MLTILSLIKGPPQSEGRHDDFWADRMSHRYTVSVLVSMAVIVTANHLVGEKIQCWTPVHFSDDWQAYTDSYCWVKNTYYLAFEDHIPKEGEETQTLAYYQWVPLILQLQALLYFLPCLLWRTLSERSGIDLYNFLTVIGKINKTDDMEERKKMLKHSAMLTNSFLTRRRQKNTGFNMSITYFLNRLCPRLGRSRGNYLTILYLVIKLLYVVNAITQFSLLNKILGVDFLTYGVDALFLAVQGEDISLSNRFPRVTMCNFNISTLGNVHRYTVQCVLPMNLFHEMVFLLLWFWMVMIIIISLYSFLLWTGRLVFEFDRHRYVAHFLQYFAASNPDSVLKANFTQRYLRHDGVFLLRLVNDNIDDVMTHDLSKALWDTYSSPNKGIELYPVAELDQLSKV